MEISLKRLCCIQRKTEPAPRSLILKGHGDNGIVHLVNAYRQQHRIRSRVVLHILVWLCLEFV
jgi:hypothetical protein